MNFSEIALKVLLIIKNKKLTNAQFWKTFSNIESVENLYNTEFNTLSYNVNSILSILKTEGIDGFVCCFDDEFPLLSSRIRGGDRPVLLLYKGDISLLKSNKNVAVIGLIDPDTEIEKREKATVKYFVEKGYNVVSGLAKGCDSIAHYTCLENGGKTIAILPTTIGNLYPKENQNLANQIVLKGGLLISEYFDEPENRYEAINRFVERDRLQAFFSNAVVLIASYRNGEGDSGSRHAMKKAKKYGITRFVMYKDMNSNNKKFGLNYDILKENDGAVILSPDTIKKFLINSTNDESPNETKYKQIGLF